MKIYKQLVVSALATSLFVKTNNIFGYGETLWHFHRGPNFGMSSVAQFGHPFSCRTMPSAGRYRSTESWGHPLSLFHGFWCHVTQGPHLAAWSRIRQSLGSILKWYRSIPNYLWYTVGIWWYMQYDIEWYRLIWYEYVCILYTRTAETC
jgi:hypothetical protein